MDIELLNEKTKIAVDKFFSLDGDTFRQKKRSLNCFIRDLQSGYTVEEIVDFLQNLNTETEYDHVLKTEIIVRFQLNLFIWEILKSGNGALIGKILKNWIFFKDIFNGITVDSFVTEILPLLSYKTRFKLVGVIGKNLKGNHELSDELFNKLQDVYGIKIATILLPNCSKKLIKETCLKFDLNLSSRCLLQIHKKDPSFLFYYFDLILVTKKKTIEFSNYIQVLQHVAQTDFVQFWSLYESYKFDFKMGRRRTLKLLPNKEIMMKCGFLNKCIFEKKHIFNAARRVGLYKDLLLKFYPDNLEDYLYELGCGYSCKQAVIYMPKSQVFSLLNELFKQKYNEDLKDYLHLIHRNYLEYLTAAEREIILDKLKDKEDLLFYYPISRSIPILSEKLKSANDFQTRQQLIGFLYSTCKVNNDEKTLLDILKLLYKRYKNDTQILSGFVSKLTNWKNYSTFTEEHWELIGSLVEYITYSGHSVDEEHFFEHHFIWLINNNKPYTNLLDDYMKQRNESKSLNHYYFFDKLPKYMKIFLEEIHKRLENKCINLYFDFLRLAVKFDKNFPGKINIINYVYILDMAGTEDFSQTGQEYYFIKYHNKDKSFDKYIKSFDNQHTHCIDINIVIYCLQNCPEQFDNFTNLPEKLSWKPQQFHQFLLCPYFVKKNFEVYKQRALTQLGDNEVNPDKICLYFLAHHKEFLRIIQEFWPPEDGKIEPLTDKQLILRQKEIVKYIPKVSYPQNLQSILKFCKGDYLKFSLGALYAIAYNVPEAPILEYLQCLYESAVSVRKHALFLGRHLLPVSLYYDFLLSTSNLEINLSMRNILLKKSLEYFIETLDRKFFELFVSNLDKIDKKDRDLYDHLSDYKKIPRELIVKYVTTVYDNMLSNEDEEIRQKGYQLMDTLPEYVMDDLELEYMKYYILNTTFSRTNFINKCLFHTTGEKYTEMQNFIFNLIVDNLRSCNITDVQLRNEITDLISSIFKKAIMLENHIIAEKLYEILKKNIPQHCFIKTKILLDFGVMFLKSGKNVDTLAKEINTHLHEFVNTYSLNIVSLYTSELKTFLHNRSIDSYEFIQKFFNVNTFDDVTCLITISFLPRSLPNEKNAYVGYVPILDSLSKVQSPSVMASLDLYFSSVNE